jgi:hypothetical protein
MKIRLHKLSTTVELIKIQIPEGAAAVCLYICTKHAYEMSDGLRAPKIKGENSRRKKAAFPPTVRGAPKME